MPVIPEEWTETERWVWHRIIAGELANLEDSPSGGGKLDPNRADGWNEGRRITTRFLRTILTQGDFAQAIPAGGVRIRGAIVDDSPLCFKDCQLSKQFWLDASRILVDVDCNDIRVGGAVSFEACLITGDVRLHGAEIEGSLNLSRTTFEGRIRLGSAKIKSDLAMNGSKVAKGASLNRITVGGAVSLAGEHTHLKAGIDLGGARIGSFLDIRQQIVDGVLQPTVDGVLQLQGATVHRYANLTNGKFDTVDVSGCSIGANLNMTGATCRHVRAASVVVGDSVLLYEGTFEEEVDFRGAKIEGTFELSGATLAGRVDLTGSTIKGGLFLGASEDYAANWGQDAVIWLRNAHARTWQDWWGNADNNAWPRRYDLAGFTYEHIGWFHAQIGSDMLERPISSYISWLEKSDGSSLQPYEQLASRFDGYGEPGKAADVRYAARERRRREACSGVVRWRAVVDAPQQWWRNLTVAFGLSVLRCTIGYGLRYSRTLGWVMIFTGLGFLVLSRAGIECAAESQIVCLLSASLDQLLPVITLDPAHDGLVLGDNSPQCVKVYFYFHRIVGWILGSFLVAGLAGLTQRN